VSVEPIIRDALIFGCLLSLLSIGLTLTYLITKVPNFSHGSIATIGTYVTLSSGEILGASPYAFIPLAFLLGAVTSLILYYSAIKPLIRRGAGLVSLMVATIAFELALIAALNMYADYVTKTFKIASRDFILRKYDFQILGEPGVFVTSPAIAVLLVVLLHIFLTKTKFGVAMRAAIEDQALAGVLGINIRRVYVVSWFLSGGLAGLAGAMLGLWFQADPGYGSRVLVSIFAASVVGGLLNIYGAILGGLLVGLSEILGTNWLGMAFGTWILPYKPVIPLIAMVVTLLFAPKGITGVKWRSLRFRWKA